MGMEDLNLKFKENFWERFISSRFNLPSESQINEGRVKTTKNENNKPRSLEPTE